MTTTPDPIPSRRSPAPAGRPAVGGRGRSGLLPDVLVEGPAANCGVVVELVDTLRAIDRLTAKATALVEHAQLTGEVEEQTGLPLELWLSAAGRRTRADRRMLTTTADLRAKLPTLADAFDAGEVSWAQVRAVVCACAKLRGDLLHAVDEALGPEIDALTDADPDALVHVVSRAVASLETTSDAEDARDGARASRERFLAIQPRLDGTGGSIYGEADAYGLAVLSEALDAGTPPPDGRLREHLGQSVDAEDRRGHLRAAGRRRMDALVALAEASLFSGAQPGRQVHDGHGVPSDPASDRCAPAVDPALSMDGLAPGTDQRRTPPPKLILTLSYESLIGLTNEPGSLLTSLTGGRLMVAADTARRLVDEAGAHLRTVVLEDTGQVLGVGRGSYRPPGWLRDAALVRDVTCRAPGCLTAARLCDLDHADPWTVDEDGNGGGATDVVNLAHLCRTDHGAKDRDGWHAFGLAEGSRRGLRRWRHRRTGLTIDTAPRTRRLPLTTTRAGPAP